MTNLLQVASPACSQQQEEVDTATPFTRDVTLATCFRCRSSSKQNKLFVWHSLFQVTSSCFQDCKESVLLNALLLWACQEPSPLQSQSCRLQQDVHVLQSLLLSIRFPLLRLDELQVVSLTVCAPGHGPALACSPS